MHASMKGGMHATESTLWNSYSYTVFIIICNDTYIVIFISCQNKYVILHQSGHTRIFKEGKEIQKECKKDRNSYMDKTLNFDPFVGEKEEKFLL